MRTKLKTDEKIEMITNPHWFCLLFPGFVAIAGVGGCIALSSLTAGISLFGMAIFIAYFFYKFIERKNNIWVVTNQRVIDEEGVISIRVKESPLDKINNVSFNQTLLGKIFGFGNVQIQTAAEVGATTYLNVEKPRELKDAIAQMQEDYKYLIVKKQASEISNSYNSNTSEKKVDITAELEKLHDLKQKGIITEEEFQALKVKLFK